MHGNRLIISVGMPKSGSAWLYNIVNDLVIINGGADARQVKSKYGLEKIMRHHNCNIARLSFLKLVKLIFISRREGDVVVKSHRNAGPAARFFARLGLIKIVYSYRDPRDVLLAVRDAGKKEPDGGFAPYVEFDDGFLLMKRYINTWKSYRAMKPAVLCIKYEDLTEHPSKVVNDLCAYLQLQVDEAVIEQTLHKYDKANLSGNLAKHLHLNKGSVNRHTEELSAEQQARFVADLGALIMEMGYPLSLESLPVIK